MKLRILAVGADKSGLFEPAIGEYLQRIGRYAKIEELELKPSKKGAQDPLRAREEEGDALLGKLRPGEKLIALDERGELLTSEELAKKVLGDAMNRGHDLAFVIGGAEGLSEQVRAKAARVLSLSRLTLAHRLARLVLAEQLYRAFTILRGEPYHK